MLRGKTIRVRGFKAYAADVRGFHFNTWKVRERMNTTKRLPARGNRVTVDIPWDVADKPGRHAPADATFKTDIYLSSTSTWHNNTVVIFSDKAKKGARFDNRRAVIDRDPAKNVMYRRDFRAISNGMNPRQVNRLVGTRGDHIEQSQHRENGRWVTTNTYYWVTPTGSTVTVTTKDGGVVSKRWRS